MPARQCSSVDLPGPLGPMTATISPAPIVTLAPCRACLRPKERWRSTASIRVLMAVTINSAYTRGVYPAPKMGVSSGSALRGGNYSASGLRYFTISPHTETMLEVDAFRFVHDHALRTVAQQQI